MPCYFLHVRDGGHLTKDKEGEDFLNLAEARAEALETAREMWAEALQEGSGRDYFDAIIIADAKGRELTTISFIEALPPRLQSKLAPACAVN
jgi:hypothetical protein